MNQIDFDLIYSLATDKNHIIPYIEGGLCDRVMENFRLQSGFSWDREQEEYDWSRMNTASASKKIRLAKSNKKPTLITDHNFNSYYDNVLRLSLFLYRSFRYKNIQGITFGNNDNMIKPLKILKHKWVLVEEHDWNSAAKITGSQLLWRCSECGLEGISPKDNFSCLVPDKFLTCEELIISNIIL